VIITSSPPKGVEVLDAPQVLFSGVTVGDLASWVDSLLFAGVLRFGAESFTRVVEAKDNRKQLAYTFQVCRARPAAETLHRIFPLGTAFGR
jgi:hypothetical protein